MLTKQLCSPHLCMGLILYRTHVNQSQTMPSSHLRMHLRKPDFKRWLTWKIETFSLQSQLRWAGHVIRKSDDRIHKILMYGQLEVGQRNVGRPWLRYRDNLKRNLKSLEIFHDSFDNRAKHCKDRRKTCHLDFASFVLERIQHLRQFCQNTKLRFLV